MPNRMLRDWTRSDKVNLLTVHAERFFTRLIMKADDYGCYYADPRLLKADLFPLLLDQVRDADLPRWLAECQKIKLIRVYEVAQKKYLQIVDFGQRLDKARNKFPLPDANDFPELVNEFPAESESEVELEKKNTGADKPPPEKKVFKKFIPPEPEEVKTFFIATIGNAKNPGYWPPDKCANQAAIMHDHYTANGWVQGRGKPIKDWKAACRNWIRNALAGTFESKPATNYTKGEIKTPKSEIISQKTEAELPKIERDISFLYDRFLEGQATIISVDVSYYNFLKKAGLISFSKEESIVIRDTAAAHILEKQFENNEVTLLRFMKLFGVLEFFKQQQAAGRNEIFKP